MRKLLILAVTLVAAFGVSTARASLFNFRGGHGGGHHGGGHHAHHGAHHHSQHHTGHHVHRHVHHAVHHRGERPFTHGWYAHHHGAWGWRNGAYGWGNPWAFATLGTTAAWLGLTAADDTAWINNSTVYTADNDEAAQTPVAETDDETASDAADQPAVAPSARDATALARTGVNDTLSGAQFLTLGVYTIAPAGEPNATATINLAVTKGGILRGTYCDLKSDQDFSIQGAVDKQTGRVAWTVGPAGREVFETSLADLTQQSGPLAIHGIDGETSEWTIAHYEPLAAENDPPYDANPAKTQQEKTSRRPNSLFD